MNLTNFEIGLILVEGSILLSFLVTLLFLKRRMNPAWTKRVKGLRPKRERSFPFIIMRS